MSPPRPQPPADAPGSISSPGGSISWEPSPITSSSCGFTAAQPEGRLCHSAWRAARCPGTLRRHRLRPPGPFRTREPKPGLQKWWWGRRCPHAVRACMLPRWPCTGTCGRRALFGSLLESTPQSPRPSALPKAPRLPGAGLLLPSLAVLESSQVVGGGKLSRAGCAHLCSCPAAGTTLSWLCWVLWPCCPQTWRPPAPYSHPVGLACKPVYPVSRTSQGQLPTSLYSLACCKLGGGSLSTQPLLLAPTRLAIGHALQDMFVGGDIPLP